MLSDMLKTNQAYYDGMMRYISDFMAPYWISLKSFYEVEGTKALRFSPEQTLCDYLSLYRFNLQIAEKGFNSSLSSMRELHNRHARKAVAALRSSFDGDQEETIQAYVSALSELMTRLAYEYPDAISKVKANFGFHFEQKGYKQVAETGRFILYQVFPTDPKVITRKKAKPVIIIPPYVLGANILCFLPKEDRSYVHAFANQGIPTYVRILKDIVDTPAVQTMTGEDDARDLRVFCQKIKRRHGRAVSLNGYCQGGFIATIGVLSGQLDGLVDTLITCVAPLDGSRSRSLVEYLGQLPERFRDLGYATRLLPNGNRVVDGRVMSWVYKLRSIDKEGPLMSFTRDLTLFERLAATDSTLGTTALAINHWLLYDRTDLPLEITRLSFESYMVPVKADGTLPVKLFGKALNFLSLVEKKINVLLCYAEKDDLVDKEAALAALDYIDAEVTIFPKGHAAIATSWSNPASACGLHTRFGDGYRGPVRFHLDLDEQMGKPRPLTVKKQPQRT